MNFKRWYQEYLLVRQRSLANDPKAVLATASHLARIQRINEDCDYIESHPQDFNQKRNSNV